MIERNDGHGADRVAMRYRTTIVTLVRDGPLTADQLAGRIGIGRTTTLRQVGALERAGLVECRVVRHGIGRPRHLYRATPEAHRALPTGYDRLADSLIDAARQLGGDELVDRLFAVRRRQLRAELLDRLAAAGMESASVEERLAVLAGVQDELGYVADVDADRGLRLRLHNCPILAVARSTPAACAAELRLIGQVLGASVERESAIAAGATACSYRIWARDRGLRPSVWVSGQMRPGGLLADDDVPQDPPDPWKADQMRSDPIR